VEGRLIFGVIDEVKLHREMKKVESAANGGKKYSSQEEWKRKSSQQQRKAKQDSSQKTLAAFLPGGKAATKEAKEENGVDGVEIYGFVLEDAKTRLSMSMPEEKDQMQSKLQCMVYKRLLEGLVCGMANDLQGAKVDEFATPVTADVIMFYLDLQGHVPFSEVFMRDASDLCEGFNLPIKVDQLPDGRWSCSLPHLFTLLADTLDDFVGMARKGAADKSNFSVIQNELRLTYRRREGKWSKRAKPKQQRLRERRTQPPRRASRVGTSIAELLLVDRSTDDLDEEAQVELALQKSLDDTSKEEEEEKLADTTVALPSSPQKSRAKDFIIGTVRFPHDSVQLQEHLVDVMAMWRGERPLRGVKVEQTWRCDHCEYQTGCEWRQMKAEESLQLAMEKRQAQQDLEMWSQVDDFPDDELMQW
jgi:exonuclease V